MATETKTMYAAWFSQWGTPTLAEVQAVETAKGWRIVSQEYLKAATIFIQSRKTRAYLRLAKA